jgi:hypothetical protein
MFYIVAILHFDLVSFYWSKILYPVHIFYEERKIMLNIVVHISNH